MSLTENILEHLQRVAEAGANLMDIALSNYPDAYRKARYSMLHGPKPFDTDWAEWYREQTRYAKLLWHLRKEGLITQRKNRDAGRSIWRITKKGLRKLRRIKEQRNNPFSVFNMPYKQSPERALTLVIFDIPEAERRKRRWLRECLKLLGFRLVRVASGSARTNCLKRSLKTSAICAFSTTCISSPSINAAPSLH